MRVASALIILAMLLVFFALPLPTSPDLPPRPQLPEDSLDSGDIIFRRGVGVASDAVLAADAGRGFSHVGMIIRHGNVVLVAHAEPAEAQGEADGTKIESLAMFLIPSRASRVAVYRLNNRKVPNAVGSGIAAAAAAEELARRHLPFDFHFDLDNPSALYCTMMVVRAYRQAGTDLDVHPSGGRIPFLHHPVMLPSDLQHSPLLLRVY